MVTADVLNTARDAAEELRRRGELERAQAIETLVAAAAATATPLPPAAAGETVDIFGVDGRTLRRWVQEGRYAEYRVGPLPIPRELVEEYVRRARTSLDLDVIPDDEAALLIADGRQAT
jgi:hypothetical protein